MPKSKEFIDSSDSASDQESGAVSTTKKTKTKETTSKDDSANKRLKTSNDGAQAEVASKRGANGERLYEFGKLRYVSVSEFRGKPYINIREYYDDKGVEKPGKKGISLTMDQWETLKTLISQVDKDLKQSK
ncbi:unnamed protein product [Adineta ricciae]|uniref:Transcriptional coactivator p15 (PC4) C-terminal domain-containing protein n=1 Tax=Adineta ricciae TaxID=249248 RepID=A0A815PIL7_ADIRI|nr:unnamed protein product [Adineta ricciae]